MTANEAAALTGLTPREFPKGKIPYLRCQLGTLVTVRRATVEPGIYVRPDVFHLLAFGETFDEAILHLPQFKNLKKLKNGAEVEL